MLNLFNLMLGLFILILHGGRLVIDQGVLSFKSFELNRRERDSGYSEYLSCLLTIDAFNPVDVERFSRHFARVQLFHHLARVLCRPVSLPVL
jgi:hypothetical protein